MLTASIIVWESCKLSIICVVLKPHVLVHVQTALSTTRSMVFTARLPVKYCRAAWKLSDCSTVWVRSLEKTGEHLLSDTDCDGDPEAITASTARQNRFPT